ncbi:hypothetical protein [Streptomyces sp. NPDC000229]|uniref:hypothetical protein n=1 Tax=Streptomyces sp. NPDC000229 TaxID=3154247 RepID=UPI003331B2C1
MSWSDDIEVTLAPPPLPAPDRPGCRRPSLAAATLLIRTGQRALVSDRNVTTAYGACAARKPTHVDDRLSVADPLERWDEGW